MKIFIGGSKTIGRLPDKAAETIAAACRNSHEILIGDCYGIDLAVQRLLAELEYENVTVFTACPKARNNIRNWQEQRIATSQTGFAAHRAKDEAMIDNCDLAILIWDGSTKGTRANLDALCHAGKRIILLDRYGAAMDENRTN